MWVFNGKHIFKFKTKLKWHLLTLLVSGDEKKLHFYQSYNILEMALI